jgi:hypothetical protein
MKESVRQRKLGGVDCRGMEIFEITPIILGGSPTDPANKTMLTREDHIKAVVYWNRIIKEWRDQRKNE